MKKFSRAEKIGTRGHVVLALFCFQPLVMKWQGAIFIGGAEDWEVFGPGQLKLYEKGGVLYGSDVGRTVWYFSAPAKFLGDK